MLDQLAPGGRMWVPLTCKDSSSAAFHLGAQVHEIYVIDRDPISSELKYKKIMDARYALLRSVNEQLSDE